MSTLVPLMASEINFTHFYWLTEKMEEKSSNGSTLNWLQTLLMVPLILVKTIANKTSDVAFWKLLVEELGFSSTKKMQHCKYHMALMDYHGPSEKRMTEYTYQSIKTNCGCIGCLSVLGCYWITHLFNRNHSWAR